MSTHDSTINLDDSSILSSTKNSSILELSKEIIDIASSDDDDENDVGNSVSENVDSASENLDNRTVELCSSEEDVSEANYITSVQSPFQVTLKPDVNLNTSSDQSSIISASQLMSDNSSYLNSNNATKAEESRIAELTTELNNHKLKLSEEVVEGVGVKIEEIGEIIEGTFRDKKNSFKIWRSKRY